MSSLLGKDHSAIPTTYESIPSVEIDVERVDLEERYSIRHHFFGGQEMHGIRLSVRLTCVLSMSLLIITLCWQIFIRDTFDTHFIGLEGVPVTNMHVYQDKKSGVWEVTSVGTNPRLGTRLGKNHPRGALAVAEYTQSVGDSGWNALSVRSTMPPHVGEEPLHSRYVPRDDVLNDYLVSKLAMGFLEGFVTCPKIQDWYRNFYQGLFDGGDPNIETLDFLEQNHDWMMEQSERHWKTSEYWLTVRGTLAQLHGMLAGIRSACPGVDYVEDTVPHVLPLSGKKNVADFDGKKRQWLGGHSGGEDDDAAISDEPTYHRGIYLPSIHRRPSLIHLLLLNANGDLYQIAAKFDQGSAPAYDDDYDADDFYSDEGRRRMRSGKYVRANMHSDGPQDLTVEQFKHAEENRGSTKHRVDHCSALIKMLPDKADVFFGHVTWDDFQNAAPRVFKTFEYPLIKEGRPAGWFVTHFSSSPGMLSSMDDFYINRGRALTAVIETSLDIHDNTLLDKLDANTNFAWVRAVVSNYLALDGESWSKLFSAHASGTYTNQWMVLDMSKFNEQDTPSKGFFTVLEEMPGLVHWEDMTAKLAEQGYWPSFNNPYFADIAKISGQDDLCLQDINQCYDTDPRSQIFAREQLKVNDLKSFQQVMGFNEWQSDPLSQNNSCYAIACRNDLQPNATLRSPSGAIDAKVSSFLMAASHGNQLPPENDYDSNSFQSVIIPEVFSRLGPTSDNQKPFCWSKFKDLRDKRGKTWNHYGHPDCFDFAWQQIPLPFKATKPSDEIPVRKVRPPQQKSPDRLGHQ